ncbi:MAG: hypothetical protein O3C21_04640, partial [Verrucomicrobia bacterium]|nr:hypothetical protein [Verrucomicrobiota bacterium]
MNIPKSHRVAAAFFIGITCMPCSVLAEILINEVHVNPPNAIAVTGDGNFEYIELKSTSGGEESTNDLTLIILDTSGANVGKVEEAWALTSLRTGSNGLLLLGNGYNTAPQGGPWSAAIEAETRGADPAGLGDDNIGPNDVFSLLLVRNFTGLQDADLDADNNGVLDSTPWSAIVDSVGLAESGVNRTYALADLTQAAFNPDNLSRIEGNLTPNSAGAWYGGEIGGTLPTDIAFSDQFFGGFKGQATPGRRNQSGSAALAEIRLNEINVNPPPDNDANFEYIELTSVNGGSVITDGYHLVVIDSKSDNDADTGQPQNLRGNIREAWDLSGFSTGANGLMLIGDDYQVSQPWGNLLDPATVLREPAGFGSGDIAANDGFTLLLVSGFTGTVGMDLDPDDNGTLNTKPWAKVHDSISSDEYVNGVSTGVPGYAAEFGGNLAALGFNVDSISRKLGSMDGNSASSWYGGTYGGPDGGSSPTNISFNSSFFGGFRGQATPGRPNLAAAATQRPDSTILINELSVDPPDVFNPQNQQFEDGQEFIEIMSTSGGIDGLNGLHLVIIDASGPPEITEAIDLSALSTGPDGLLLMGDNTDDVSLLPTEFRPFIERTTHIEDPDGVDKGDFGPNNNYVALVVRGYTLGTTMLDVNSPPWTEVKDSVGVATLGGVITNANIQQAEFTPDHVARIPGNIATNQAASWYGGGFVANADGSGSRGEIAYGDKWFGPFKGGSTPGGLNHAATPSNAPVLLNEVVVNPAGADTDLEFIELLGTSGGAQSLEGYHLLLIDVRGTNTGTIMEAWNLDGFATGSNGLALIGDGYPESIPPGGPYKVEVDAATSMIDPLGFDLEDLGGSGDLSRSNNEFCLLLVRGFSGDTGIDLETDDLNGFDTTPWSALVDSVGYREYDTQLAAHIGINYALADLSQTGFEPDAFARKRGKNTAHSAAAWYGGSLIAGDSSLAFDQTQHFGLTGAGKLTPGAGNMSDVVQATDPDGDGISTLLETALGMNPQKADLQNYPIAAGTITNGGQTFLSFQYAQIPGGTGTTGVNYTAAGITYTVESTSDLQDWQPTGDDLVVVSITQSGAVEKVIVRHSTPSDSTEMGLFFRLAVTQN